MPDNLNIRMPADQNKINLNQKWEVEFWTKKLGVSEIKLRNAVKKVGSNVDDVKKHLKLIK